MPLQTTRPYIKRIYFFNQSIPSSSIHSSRTKCGREKLFKVQTHWLDDYYHNYFWLFLRGSRATQTTSSLSFKKSCKGNDTWTLISPLRGMSWRQEKVCFLIMRAGTLPTPLIGTTCILCLTASVCYTNATEQRNEIQHNREGIKKLPCLLFSLILSINSPFLQL